MADNQNNGASPTQDLPKSDHIYKVIQGDNTFGIGIDIYDSPDKSHKEYGLYKLDGFSRPLDNNRYDSLSEAIKAEVKYISNLEGVTAERKPFEGAPKTGSQTPATRTQREKPEHTDDKPKHQEKGKMQSDRLDNKVPEQEGKKVEEPKPNPEKKPDTRIESSQPQTEESSILKEVVFGGFYGGDSSLAGAGLSVGIGLIPIVGQIADARDTLAAIKDVWENPESLGAWGGLGMAGVGWLPGIGDAIKGARKGKEALEASEELIKKGSQEIEGELIKHDKKLTQLDRANARQPSTTKDPIPEQFGDRLLRDKEGRTLQLTGTLEKSQLNTGEEVSKSARKEIRKSGDYDAGHIRANRLGGIGELENLFPQFPSLNRGQFRVFESRLAQLVSGLDQSQNLVFSVRFKYNNGSKVPTQIIYRIRAEGSTIRAVFNNNTNEMKFLSF